MYCHVSWVYMHLYLFVVIVIQSESKLISIIKRRPAI